MNSLQNMCEKILDQVQLAIKSHNSDIETLKVQMKSLQEENIALKGEVISLKIDIITLKVDKSEKVSCFCVVITKSYHKFYNEFSDLSTFEGKIGYSIKTNNRNFIHNH